MRVRVSCCARVRRKIDIFERKNTIFFLASNEATKFFHVVTSSKYNRARILIQLIMSEKRLWYSQE